MALVQSSKAAGSITVEASSPGLTPASASISSKAAKLRPQVRFGSARSRPARASPGLWRSAPVAAPGGFGNPATGQVFTLRQNGNALTGTVEGSVGGRGFGGGSDTPTAIEDGKVNGVSHLLPRRRRYLHRRNERRHHRAAANRRRHGPRPARRSRRTHRTAPRYRTAPGRLRPVQRRFLRAGTGRTRHAGSRSPGSAPGEGLERQHQEASTPRPGFACNAELTENAPRRLRVLCVSALKTNPRLRPVFVRRPDRRPQILDWRFRAHRAIGAQNDVGRRIP